MVTHVCYFFLCRLLISWQHSFLYDGTPGHRLNLLAETSEGLEVWKRPDGYLGGAETETPLGNPGVGAQACSST